MDAEEEIDNLRKRVHDMANEFGALKNSHTATAVLVENLTDIVKEFKTDSRAFMDRTSVTLADISKQTTATNGRVTTLETRMVGHDREFSDIKRNRTHRAEPAEKSDAITIHVPMNGKTITAMIAALIAIALMGVKAWGGL